MKKLQFRGLESIDRGDLYKLLKESYRNLYEKYDKENKHNYLTSWSKNDSIMFDNPKTRGKCIFVSFLNEDLVGFISFDPRSFPEFAIIGQNCIHPKYKGMGYGKQQLSYLLDYFKTQGVKKAKVSTGENKFFIPAQKMYLGAGFKQTKKESNQQYGYNEIYYEKQLQ